jgi:ketosteroid isomerase-like protein
MGPVLQGTAAVRESWQDIFQHAPTIRFRIERVQSYQENPLAIYIVRENIQVQGESGPRPPIYATNVFRLTANGWRMVLHHASPYPHATDEPAPKPRLLH